MKYLKDKIASKKIEDTVELEIEGKVKDVIHKAFKHTLANKTDFKKEVIEALMSLECENNDGDASAECGDFASFLVDEIDKYEKKLAGNDTRLRFSPRILRMCMSLWLRSNARYQEFRAANLQVSRILILVSFMSILCR